MSFSFALFGFIFVIYPYFKFTKNKIRTLVKEKDKFCINHLIRK